MTTVYDGPSFPLINLQTLQSVFCQSNMPAYKDFELDCIKDLGAAVVSSTKFS